MKIRRKQGLAIIFLALLLKSHGLDAAESIVTPGPAGGTDIKQAELPPPGLYGLTATVDGALTRIYDPHYQPSNFNGYGAFLGAGLLYVYPTEVFGGHFASSLSGVGVLAGAGLPTTKLYHSNGATDTYTDVLEYSNFFPSNYYSKQFNGSQIPYGLELLASFGLVVPTGFYQKGAFFNVGSNFFDLVPNVAVTYTMPAVLGPTIGQTTEISGRVFYSTFTENPATSYQTGRIVDLDWSLSQRAGAFQYGVAGVYYRQLDDDKQFGILLPGRKVEDLGLGPIISYQFVIDNRPYEFTIKSKIPVKVKDTVDGPDITLRIATKLF